MDVVCGASGLTRVLDCANEVHLGWQRWATPDEIAQLHAMGELPRSETEAIVLVYACTTHELDPDRAARIHDATCRAPAEPGDCSACRGPA
ncbi:MAG TPA: hypothetical protein VGX25_05360 [Actinophytocola sp.]|uniref:hypothetical protein n=1 Tax=Actinophytocola sp. TaxID=1872138 RepID=UPI002DDD8770|nr:hypothetical protein [Actinophytocola sp.]HEV2778810.1 hypothetical protein [Actinophytocola sp.]